MSCSRFMRQRELGPILDAEVFAAAGSPLTAIIDVSGMSQLTLEIDLDYAACTSIDLKIECTDDLSGTPTWRRIPTTSAAAGAITVSNGHYVMATGSADYHQTINQPLNYKAIRLTFTSTGGTTDTLTVRGRVSCTP